jgi:hypothetical protein
MKLPQSIDVPRECGSANALVRSMHISPGTGPFGGIRKHVLDGSSGARCLGQHNKTRADMHCTRTN